MEVIDKDLGYNRIMNFLDSINDTEIVAGILKDSGSDSNGTLYTDIALYNEFGTYRIPARPAVRIASDENEEVWAAVIDGKITDAIDSKGRRSKNKMCKDIGKMMVRHIQSVFGDTSKLAPNAPSTIRRKGRNEPLVDTGTLRSKVNYRVED